MNYPAEFIHQLKERSGARCECERRECHETQGRCSAVLADDPAEGKWTPVFTGERLTLPPAALDYMALCARCAVPRTGKRA